MPVNTGFQRFRQADQDLNPSIHYYLTQTNIEPSTDEIRENNVIPGVCYNALLMRSSLKVLNLFKNMEKVTMCISHKVSKVNSLKRSLICLINTHKHMCTCTHSIQQ